MGQKWGGSGGGNGRGGGVSKTNKQRGGNHWAGGRLD